MDNIISFNQIKDEQENVFAIRDDDGELKEITEWTGEDWYLFIEEALASMAAQFGVSKYDVLADFMRQILAEDD